MPAHKMCIKKETADKYTGDAGLRAGTEPAKLIKVAKPVKPSFK